MNLSFNNLSKGYEGKMIFENIGGQISDGEKIGLIGANGVGKTTLVNILTGKEESDTGEIRCSPYHINILYIEQYPKFERGITVYQDIKGFLSRSKDYQDDFMDMEEIGAMARAALNKVGLGREKWDHDVENLSGGEKTKLILSRMLVAQFDFLILDEPTNHLDIDTSDWLEDFIKGLDKPMIIISHDRFFLDNTVNRIWELADQGLKAYEGNYSSYRDQEDIRLKHIEREYEKQQTRIQELREMISDRENWYRSAHKSAGQNDYLRSRAKKHASSLKAKRSQLERLEEEKIEKPRKQLSPAFEIINKNIIGRKFPRFLIRGKNISKSFGQNQVLDNISFNVERKDKIAVIGANGSGKTTFLKTLCGIHDDYVGTLQISPSVNMGYFSQELENLNYGATILEDVLTVGGSVGDVRLLLACLLFRGDDVFKRVGDLSMGEKGRVAFAKLILSDANLLVLDEPTNYMDIQSREKVEEALEQFEGTIIFVSHDRYFVKRLANRIFVIEDKRLRCFDSNYEVYLARTSTVESQGTKEDGQRQMKEDIMKLETELAYLGGKLDGTLDEEEKEELSKRYLQLARELNRMKGL
jgi:ATP-binding cassette subfamily F protein 3